MQIKVGEYVRLKTGTIDKVRKIINEKFYIDHLCGYTINEVLKHSFNIKNLLKVGDIIKYKITVSTTLETKGYIEGIVDIADEEHLQAIKEDENYQVLEILTKEKYENNSYKVRRNKE